MLRAWIEKLIGVKTFVVFCLIVLVFIILYYRFSSSTTSQRWTSNEAVAKVAMNQRRRDIKTLAKTIWDGDNLIRDSKTLLSSVSENQNRRRRRRQQTSPAAAPSYSSSGGNNEETLELIQIRTAVTPSTAPTIFDYQNKIKTLVKKENDLFLDPGSVIVPEFRSAGEKLCKRILEQDLFPGKKFETYRPNFLRREKTGRNLEIDLYNPNLKLGIEFNGSQHYVYTHKFHKTGKDFQLGLVRDLIKKKKCRNAGILLIVIPFTINTYYEIKDFLLAIIKKKAPHLLSKKTVQRG